MLFALANAGGVVGYLPALTLLLPLKIAAIAPDARIGIITATTLLGAIVASLSNIAFGWWSDRSVAHRGGRRRFVAGGLCGTVLSYAALVWVTTPAGIIAAIVALQLALNAALVSILAMMADEIDDDHKGLAGGLLALGTPLASLVSAAVVGLGALGEEARFAWVAAAMVVCIAPLVFTRPTAVVERTAAVAPPSLSRRDLVTAWSSRTLVQVAGCVVFYCLLYYFASLSPTVPAEVLAARIGQLLVVSYVVPLPIAILCGRLSDRWGRRKPFLVGAAAAAAAGLAGMAVATDERTAMFAFTLYAIGSATFLSLHATFAMQLLPSAAHRGRDLGLVNLSNTLPAMIGPVLTWLLASPDDFSPLMLALAVLTGTGGLTMLAVRGRR